MFEYISESESQVVLHESNLSDSLTSKSDIHDFVSSQDENSLDSKSEKIGLNVDCYLQSDNMLDNDGCNIDNIPIELTDKVATNQGS